MKLTIRTKLFGAFALLAAVGGSGGLLSLLYEMGETDEAGIIARVTRIGRTVARLLERSGADRLPPHRLADTMVEEKLAAARRILTPTRA